jgi:hypothetical protein
MGIRQTRAELVVLNHASERRELSDEPAPPGIAPQQVDVGNPARDDHQIHRAVANDLIGDVSPGPFA